MNRQDARIRTVRRFEGERETGATGMKLRVRGEREREDRGLRSSDERFAKVVFDSGMCEYSYRRGATKLIERVGFQHVKKESEKKLRR